MGPIAPETTEIQQNLPWIDNKRYVQHASELTRIK